MVYYYYILISFILFYKIKSIRLGTFRILHGRRNAVGIPDYK